ncbi:hypothetical protein [Actinoplanes aureus]|uniref:Uncharacterized protein n=1 Tax=Actinoplanes aureus TaxID=2792083 RepID=A0A931C6X7_9ACTN|nr:hypothetical protein [Actinoplanes aureus]MBG0562502.1 hypothetical protein [Actinoplanes aureus]
MLKSRLPLAAIVLLLAVPVASWWLIGDLTSESLRQLEADGVPLDYGSFGPGTLGPAADRTLGIVACVAAAGALGVLIRSAATRRLDARWWLALVPLIAVGVFAGWAWRVMTMGVIGANIGAGLLVLFVMGAAGILLVGVAVAALTAFGRRAFQRTR